MLYITLGRIDNSSQAYNISQQAPEYPGQFEDIDERCEWAFIDESELNSQLRSARDLQKGVTTKQFTIYADGEKGHRGRNAILETRAGAYLSYIMTLDARQLTRAYDELGRDTLFSLNIRNYIGNTGTNKEIIKSSENEPAEFFIYNNGISCLATKVAVSEDHLEVRTSGH